MAFHIAEYTTLTVCYTSLMQTAVFPEPKAATIRQLRHHLGLNQTEFGALLHSSMRAVQQWESGERKIHLSTWELALIKAERIKPLPEVWA